MKLHILAAAFLLSITMPAMAQKTKIAIETDSGRIVLALYDGTPQHRDNMIKLVKAHFYDSTLWHRVIPGFVIQGGDPQSKTVGPGVMLGNGDVGYRVPAEIKDEYYHLRGAVGMARDNNPDKASSGCQFYIVTGKPVTDDMMDNLEKGRIAPRKFSAAQRAAYKKLGGTPMLDGGYTVFGEVVEGMDVVDRISKAATASERPTANIPMRKVYVLKKRRFFLF